MARSTEPVLEALLAGIEDELPQAIALRHRLHATPELAHAEQQTAASVAVAATGRIARVDPGTADGAGSRAGAVAVRAELDGLPLRERTGAPGAATLCAPSRPSRSRACPPSR